jgi:phosphoribosylaminoimidazolecarboxamide formyltransferase/IMP cyclohydrolase
MAETGPDLKRMYRTVMDDHFPGEMTIRLGETELHYRKRTWAIPGEDGTPVEKGLRYGENPGQEAALYELVGGNLTIGDCAFIRPGRGLVSCLSEEGMLQFGKHPGKINLTDIDNALNILRYLSDRPAVAIMKHNNPCGAACGADAAEAYERANSADRLAAFGGCAAVNVPVTVAAAEAMSRNYLEVVVAPDYEEGAVEVLKGRKNLRIVRIGRIDRIRDYASERFLDIKSLIDGGLVLQQSPLNRVGSVEDFLPAEHTAKDGTLTRIARAPTTAEAEDLLFAWAVEQGVTSNSVLIAKDGRTVAIGTGEQDRVGVAEIAVYKAYKKAADEEAFRRHGVLFFEVELKAAAGELPASEPEEIRAAVREARGGIAGGVAVSDGFFPKRDGVDVLLREGVTAIAQPGGSLGDREIIEVMNDAGATMVFTGQRAFRH